MNTHDLKIALLALADGKPHGGIIKSFAEFTAGEIARRGWPKSPGVPNPPPFKPTEGLPYDLKAIVGQFADAVIQPTFMSLCQVMREIFPASVETRPFTPADGAAIAGQFELASSPISDAYERFLVGELSARGWPIRPAPKRLWPEPVGPAHVDLTVAEVVGLFSPALHMAQQITATIVTRIFVS
jgi:hypothetical protein